MTSQELLTDMNAKGIATAIAKMAERKPHALFAIDLSSDGSNPHVATMCMFLPGIALPARRDNIDRLLRELVSEIRQVTPRVQS